MPVISGLYQRNGKPIEVELFNSQLVDNRYIQQLFAPNLLFISQQKTTVSADNRFCLVGDVDLHNLKELQSQFAFSEIDNNTAEHLIIRAYEKWGASCTEHFIGDFMFVIWDNNENCLFCGRDQLGKVPFYYYLDDSVFIFSNAIHFPSQFKNATSLNEDWIERFLVQNQTDLDMHETIYKDISKVPPSHTLQITASNVKLTKYWQFSNKQQQISTNFNDAADILLQHIDNAVRLNIGNNVNVGVELSGGLDSSTIAALAKKYTSNSLWSYSNVLPKEYKSYFNNFADESQAIGIIQDYLSLTRHRYVDNVPTDPFAILDNAIETIGYPTYMIVNVYQQYIYKLVQQNSISLLLSGFGGDEMVSANSYKVYVDYSIRSGKIVEAASAIKAKGYSTAKAYLHVGYRYLQYLNFSDKGEHKKIKQDISNLFLKDGIYSDSLVRNSLPKNIKTWYMERIAHPGLIERLETGYHISSLYNIKYKYPLLHLPLLEFFHSLPDDWNIRHKHGRALFRKAIHQLLPPEITQMQKATNTAVIPVLKIEVHQYFQLMKDWLLGLPNNHLLFNYVDRLKVQQLQKDEKIEMRIHAKLLRLIMLAMFFDKQKDKPSYDIW